jgi:hypothetical protein
LYDGDRRDLDLSSRDHGAHRPDGLRSFGGPCDAELGRPGLRQAGQWQSGAHAWKAFRHKLIEELLDSSQASALKDDRLRALLASYAKEDVCQARSSSSLLKMTLRFCCSRFVNYRFWKLLSGSRARMAIDLFHTKAIIGDG